ncbi:MAG: aspartate kinase [Candidatus Fimadaptatus sp.]|jgi:aspartate kinase
MGIIVTKFGGSSLADAGQFRKVHDILLADPDRRFAVPSAPGKRNKADTKVTDMLYACHNAVVSSPESEAEQRLIEAFEPVIERFTGIASDLGLKIDLMPILTNVRSEILRRRNSDYAASRGEYLNGRLLASYMGWDFIDPADFFVFSQQGVFQAELTNTILSEELRHHEHAVIPGFYGAMPDGQVKTFSRGGSDITGAVVARAVDADKYENWTDVSGFLMADPRIIDNPRRINQLTYRELRELSYMGATVLHEDAVFPVRRAGIPTNIRNTNAPDDPGTMIVCDISSENQINNQAITGIAGHTGFTILSIEKAMMNSELGVGRRVLSALEDYGVSFEHLPTGIDTMCVIINEKEFNMHQEELLRRIKEDVQPDAMELKRGLALIATVGRGMTGAFGTAAKLFTALAESRINVRMIDQGSSELNIIVGVDVADFENAIRAIYKAFVE